MANDDLKNNFVKEVNAAAKRRFVVEVFADMVRAMAIAIEVTTRLDSVDELEAEYAQIKGRYEPAEFEHFYRAFAIVLQALERAREDFLGHALEELGAANTHNGQFLTPVCVSRMLAKVNCSGRDRPLGEVVTLTDPACGSSVLLIEGAEALIADGVRQADILLVAGDVDGRACDISYIQLSLLGYAAVVQHMDALVEKRYSPDRFTPGYFLHCMPMRRPVERTKVSDAEPVVAEERPKGEAKKTPQPIDVRKLEQAEFNFG